MSAKELVKKIIFWHQQDLYLPEDGLDVWSSWFAASRAMNDPTLREELEEIGPADFAAEWERQVAAALAAAVEECD